MAKDSKVLRPRNDAAYQGAVRSVQGGRQGVKVVESSISPDIRERAMKSAPLTAAIKHAKERERWRRLLGVTPPPEPTEAQTKAWEAIVKQRAAL